MPAVWNGSLISGRYGQKRDSQGLFESFANISDELLARNDFPRRGSLPHHDEIAVDEGTITKSHRLYNDTTAADTDRLAFENQFRWRRNTAINHIRKAFQDNWRPGP